MFIELHMTAQSGHHPSHAMLLALVGGIKGSMILKTKTSHQARQRGHVISTVK